MTKLLVVPPVLVRQKGHQVWHVIGGSELEQVETMCEVFKLSWSEVDLTSLSGAPVICARCLQLVPIINSPHVEVEFVYHLRCLKCQRGWQMGDIYDLNENNQKAREFHCPWCSERIQL